MHSYFEREHSKNLHKIMNIHIFIRKIFYFLQLLHNNKCYVINSKNIDLTDDKALLHLEFGLIKKIQNSKENIEVFGHFLRKLLQIENNLRKKNIN